MQNTQEVQRGKGKASIIIGVIALILSVFSIMLFFAFYTGLLPQSNAKTINQEPNSSTESQALSQLNNEITTIAEKVIPSVVSIVVSVPSGGASNLDAQASKYEGSGIILTQDGFIATNYHVVEPLFSNTNASMCVQLANGQQCYLSEYIGGDEINDLAVIKIEITDLVAANIGSSDDLSVGEFAMAVGNPLGAVYASSVTIGHISGLDRLIETENTTEKMIQTDAAINPGNSGGALVNSRGEVIGINTIKIASTNVESLGFAIPIDFAKPILDSLMKYGYVKGRVTTGISGIRITQEAAAFYNVPLGILVTEVAPGSAADTAGIKVNDIITDFDGKKVSSMSAVNTILKTHKAGDIVALSFYRDGNIQNANLTLTEAEK